MKNFIKFLIETNDIVPYDFPQVKGPDHRSHPLSHFLNFVKNEIPYAGEDYSTHKEIRHHLNAQLERLLGEDPSHFNKFYRELKTDEEGKPKEADLFDVLYHLTKKAKNAAYMERKKKDPSMSTYDSEEIHESGDEIRKHLEKEAERALVRAAKRNPELKGKDSLMDIKV
jgi:hypothetical protein